MNVVLSQVPVTSVNTPVTLITHSVTNPELNDIPLNYLSKECFYPQLKDGSSSVSQFHAQLNEHQILSSILDPEETGFFNDKYDFFVAIAPKKKMRIKAKVQSIKKATPKIYI